jgi:hypothetical protein
MKRRKSKKPEGLEGYVTSLREVAYSSQKKEAWIKYQRALQQLEMPLDFDPPFQQLHIAVKEAVVCNDLRLAMQALQAEYRIRGLRSLYSEKLSTVHEADSGHHPCPHDEEKWDLKSFHSEAPTCCRCGACDCDKCEHDQHYWECRSCWRDTHDERCEDIRNDDPCTHDFEPGDTECCGLRSGLVCEDTDDALCESCGQNEGIRIVSCDC